MEKLSNGLNVHVLKTEKNGYFCEHLIALMVHIDREQPSLFENLDKKVPIKLPKGEKEKI